MNITGRYQNIYVKYFKFINLLLKTEQEIRSSTFGTLKKQQHILLLPHSLYVFQCHQLANVNK